MARKHCQFVHGVSFEKRSERAEENRPADRKSLRPDMTKANMIVLPWSMISIKKALLMTGESLL